MRSTLPAALIAFVVGAMVYLVVQAMLGFYGASWGVR